MPEITAEKLKAIDEKRQQRITRIKENERYVKGNNPDTLDERPMGDPDNRITIPFAKMAVDTLCGYAGRAGDLQTTWELQEADTDQSEEDDVRESEYINARREIAEFNDDPIETSELYQEALTQGVSYELFWVSVGENEADPVVPEYKIVPNSQIVIIKSNDIKPKIEAAVRFWMSGKDRFADVYYPHFSHRWERKKDNDSWMRSQEGDTAYPYEDVPVAVYPISADELPVFEAEKDLITGNDKLLNKSVNEVDRFNAVIALFPGKITKEIADKLKEMKVFDDLQDFAKWPEYLEKNLAGVTEFYEKVSERLERLFHKSIKIPDFSDENFVNAQSGLAMAYKLIGLEFMASKIETYFLRGLKQRNKLINQVMEFNGFEDAEDYKMVVSPQRNLPVDEAAKAEIAIKLSGILSTETLLRFLPKTIVEDVQKEKARIEAEQPQSVIPGLDGDGDDRVTEE